MLTFITNYRREYVVDAMHDLVGSYFKINNA